MPWGTSALSELGACQQVKCRLYHAASPGRTANTSLGFLQLGGFDLLAGVHLEEFIVRVMVPVAKHPAVPLNGASNILREPQRLVVAWKWNFPKAHIRGLSLKMDFWSRPQ
jgi:hypothetical protein